MVKAIQKGSPKDFVRRQGTSAPLEKAGGPTSKLRFGGVWTIIAARQQSVKLSDAITFFGQEPGRRHSGSGNGVGYPGFTLR